MYSLKPEVPGSIGSNSIIEYENGRIKKINHLEFVFDGWLGDELLTSHPSFIITDSLARHILEQKLTGFTCDKNIVISKSDIFETLYPNRTLPEFSRLLIHGSVEIENDKIVNWSGHDFCLWKKVELIVTTRAFEELNKINGINNCEYVELEIA